MNFSLPDVNSAWLVIIGIFVLAGVMIIGGTIWQWLNAAPAKRPPAEGGRPSAPPPCRISTTTATSKPRPIERRRINYRTLDGTVDYEFFFVHLPGGWRIYILDQPSYDGWPEDAASTHRHFDDDHPYICWTKPITTFERAKEIATRWAEATEEYRETGTKF